MAEQREGMPGAPASVFCTVPQIYTMGFVRHRMYSSLNALTLCGVYTDYAHVYVGFPEMLTLTRVHVYFLNIIKILC